MDKKNDISDRLIEFEAGVIEFLNTLPDSPENKTIYTQLLKSACSATTKYKESQSVSSKNDVTNSVQLSLREMRESHYLLRIIKRTLNDVNRTDLTYLIIESGELKNILESLVQ